MNRAGGAEKYQDEDGGNIVLLGKHEEEHAELVEEENESELIEG